MHEHVSIYQTLVGLLVEADQTEDAFAYAELGKSRAMLDLLAEVAVRASRGADPELVAEENRPA